MNKYLTDNIFPRRSFLKMAGGAAVFALAGGINVSFAEAVTDQRFVFIILRGAMDGLAAVPAYGDRAYAAARGGLALPAGAYQPLDNMFGLHKSFESFGRLYQAREAAIIHAVATPYRERSHFDAQNVLESGGIAAHNLNDGWLNRALAVMGGRRDSLGLAVGQTIPLALQGKAAVGTWAPSSQGLPDDTLMLSLSCMYQKDEVFHNALAEAVSVHGVADAALGDAAVPGNGARGLRNRQVMLAMAGAVGKILADPKGPRIATMEMTGWDTHAQQGTETGILANNFAALDAAFEGLKGALGPLWNKTVILAATEFGRTVAGNGTGGSDHGTASAALIAGGNIAGGRVLAQWPGLDQTQLYQGRDLAPTTDLRQVGKSILTSHMGLASGDIEKNVFPGSSGARALDGLFRA